ncbi:hypothetical protein [Dyadobacter aurulentus]|uniref:hypothetical protein n=1 Tax=Dyadobacter sp. UC 10 TaxID=2605428 RepID=UPI0011F14902|nr:hypothetical protein [Dyadobacter sp. UC 10]KAA0989076.1 hypothetical protein FXO21_02290 [Dyadobacter sp. UC 10]
MKHLRYLIAFALLSIFLLAGCDPCSDTVDRIASQTSVYLKIVDQNGTSLVDSLKGPYYPDSVKVTTTETANTLFGPARAPLDTSDFLFELHPPLNASLRSVVLLHLNQNDTDTLQFDYDLITHKCGSYYQFSTFWLNGKEIALTKPYGILVLKK